MVPPPKEVEEASKEEEMPEDEDDSSGEEDQEQVLNDTVDGKEIYNTIRRKTKDAFYKNIVKKGYLLKKEGSDAQLIYFESEKRATKPKGLIDLSVCSVYVVHDSLFGRPNCFQIVVQHFSEEHYIFYFAGETPEQAEVSSLVLHIEEAHKLPVKHFTNPYCNIYLNSVQVAKTHAREGQNPVWSEEFVFDDLPPDINRFEITLSNKTKKSKDPDILFMRCQLSRLQKGHATDEWFLLSSHIPLKGIEPGSLRVRARYSMEKIMPEEEYSEFKEEPYMEGVNPFIKSNKHRMIMFLDELGNVPELPDTTEHSRTDLSRDLAALHEICVAHSDELRTLSNERGAQQHVLKKLLAITELLQQKQNQYTKTNDVR
ncbi:Ras GTPase-activating protein 1 [Tupaia chinensis]|uniref:Ras GTPase-activating protein 1 n=1 Tax=Tupaia chinensis TaxID=246437 RepID=L8Y7L5_TUPCH|nr:Ras GTPase-activating protein 1 [Tupaia chinensis]